MGYAEDAIAELHGFRPEEPTFRPSLQITKPEQGSMNKVLAEVAQERIRQVKKWGQQNHGPERYYAILAEEVGEVAKEVVEWAEVIGTLDGYAHITRLKNMRDELIQSAAVAVAFVEALDRREDLS